MMNLVKTILLFLIFVFVPIPAWGEYYAFWGGVDDNFALPADPAYPSSDLLRILAPFGETSDFDIFSIDDDVAHTFTGLPVGIIEATLELKVKAGSSGSVYSDGIYFTFANPSSAALSDALAYGRTFGIFGGGSAEGPFPNPDPGLLINEEWSHGDEATLTLDLSSLPLANGSSLNLLPQLNEMNFIDVVVGDDSGVDYMLLTLTIPEPTIISLLALGLFPFLRKRNAKS